MSEDDSPPPPEPAPVRPSAAWLAEQRAKNAAYERQRVRYTEAWHRRLAGLADEPEPEEETGSAPADPQQPSRKRRSPRARGKIHDPRQRDLDFEA